MRVAWLKDLRMADVEQVGGKNASLGEMISNLAAAGIRVPSGFATTAQAYREFLGELGPRIFALALRAATEIEALMMVVQTWAAELGETHVRHLVRRARRARLLPFRCHHCAHCRPRCR